MCGFVAIAGEPRAGRERVVAGLDAIRHRGPDGDGIWHSPDHGVWLGHVRLAIIDVSPGGAQPMLSGDGRGAIAFNGEIYNYRELGRGLDVPLRSTSDTEVLVELLRQSGRGAISFLRGMFAFAYWDGEELLLVRDRLGIKPLYYSADSAQVIAGSEIGAVLAMRADRPRVDYAAIDDYLTYLYVPAPRTGLEGIRELLPGHLLRWRPGRGPIVERYWSVPRADPRSRLTPDELHDALEDSVRAHLVSDVPVGVFLSGGLDSSSLVALAAKHYSGRLRTFTITFGDEGRFLDERSFAREVATKYGTDHQEIPVRPDAADILPRMVAHFGQPFGNPTAVLSHALSRQTREHVKVALAGDGGDEVFGGYPRYQGVWAAEALRGVPSPLKRWIRQAFERSGPVAHARGVPLDRARRFLSSSDLPLDQMYFRWVTYQDDVRKSDLLVDRASMLAPSSHGSSFAFLARLRADLASDSMRDAAPLLDLSSFLPYNVLAYGDRMSMAHGLEVRVPLCDHVLVEKVAPLPLSRKLPGGIQKGLFRWAMRHDLSFRITTHRKVGFNPPISAWLRGPLAPALHEYLGDRAVRDRGLFSPRAVEGLRSRFAAGHGADGHILWSLLVLEEWLRWLDKQPYAGAP
jgi:asparagine synthase (glutamine-hydrolysing)